MGEDDVAFPVAASLQLLVRMQLVFELSRNFGLRDSVFRSKGRAAASGQSILPDTRHSPGQTRHLANRLDFANVVGQVRVVFRHRLKELERLFGFVGVYQSRSFRVFGNGLELVTHFGPNMVYMFEHLS